MKSILEQEIKQQPEVIEKLIAGSTEAISRIATRLRNHRPRFVVMAARGTSDNAATYAKYLFGSLNAMPVVQSAPSLHTIYHRPPDMRDSVVIAISQSGEAPDVLAVMESARHQGAFTLAITNRDGSPMVKMADETILLNAGEERSVAATKTYTAQLTAIALLAAHWNGSALLKEDLSRLVDLVTEVLGQEEAAARLARHWKDERVVDIVGRGMNHATVYEIAIKTKELNYITTDPYSAADFRHGPIAVVEKGFPVLVVAPMGESLPDVIELVGQLEKLQADLAIISNDVDLLKRTDYPLRLPSHLPEWLSPIVAVVPGQMFAMHLALEKGYNVDHPRTLRKVTLTR